MATTTQSYASHAHRPTLTTIAGLFAFIALALVIRVIAREPTIEHLALLSLNCSAIALVLISRAYTVRLQDRIIRLEMHGRLDRLGRAADFGRLSIKQLTALRFASDRDNRKGHPEQEESQHKPRPAIASWRIPGSRLIGHGVNDASPIRRGKGRW